MTAQIRNYLFSWKKNGFSVEDTTTGLSAEKIRLQLIDVNEDPITLKVVLHKNCKEFSIKNLTKAEYEVYMKLMVHSNHEIINSQYY